MKTLVIGAGMMGSAAAYDLANSPGVASVIVADRDGERAMQVAAAIGPKAEPATLDTGVHADVIALMRRVDGVIGATSYTHNVALAKAAIEAKVRFCDLGGNMDVVYAQMELDAAARAAGVLILPNCGLAPGMACVIASGAAKKFSSVEEIHIRVGGLPQKPEPPLNYQIVFSPEGLINEYIEPARVIRDGEIVEVGSMTELEWLEFPPPYGKLEAFQTSGGTSTLPDTFFGKVRELDYKTLRYPGHCEQFKLLIDLGLTSSEPVSADGATVSPRRVLNEVLLRNLPADGPDLVFVSLAFTGTLEGQTRTLRYTIIDRQDEQTGLSAMMRTTAFPASIIAQMMARGETTRRGAVPQELAVSPDKFVAELARRNIVIRETVSLE